MKSIKGNRISKIIINLLVATILVTSLITIGGSLYNNNGATITPVEAAKKQPKKPAKKIVQKKKKTTVPKKSMPAKNTASGTSGLTSGDSSLNKNESKNKPAPVTTNQTSTPATKKFTIVAKQFSFEPKTIRVKKGDKVSLEVRSLDVSHGFFLSAFGISQTIIPASPTVIEFTADKSGTFPFFCSVFCGPEHGQMTGEIIVE